MPRGFGPFGVPGHSIKSDPLFGPNRIRGAELRTYARKVGADPYANETITIGNRKGPVTRRPRFDLSSREFARYKAKDFQRTLLQQHTGPLLAQAGNARQSHVALRTDAGGSGPGRKASGYDLAGKLRNARATKTRFYLPYRGPGSLGPAPTHRTALGKGVWQTMQRQKVAQAKRPAGQQRLGSCWRVTMKRLEAGYQATYGRSLQGDLSPREKAVIDTIAGSRASRRSIWRKLPAQLRYRGVPGAGAALGLGRVVDSKDVWAGALEPGAPLQTWQTARALGGTGHSAVFERYVRDKAGHIIGLVYSDQNMK